MAKRTVSDFKRRKNDAYDTPIVGIKPLLSHLPKKCRFIEPCAGKGDMVDFLNQNGHECVGAYDINPRRKDIQEADIFDFEPYQLMDCDYIITNPPWTRQLLHPMIEFFSSVKPTFLLFDADWAFTKQAVPYMKYCDKIIAIPRLKWIPDSPYSGKDNCAWYLFNQPSRGDTKFYPRD